uniref:Uncharacterized protein n=1 Tax=Ixodes ricinus TaxID=34613 RepID=A0A6B0UCG0_IXORI
MSAGCLILLVEDVSSSVSRNPILGTECPKWCWLVATPKFFTKSKQTHAYIQANSQGTEGVCNLHTSSTQTQSRRQQAYGSPSCPRAPRQPLRS